MKRSNFGDSNQFPLYPLKKQKIIQLSGTQKKIADDIIPYLLEQGRTDLIETQFDLAFSVPKKVEALLTYTNYQMFWWAIEHQDFKLMEYILSKTTERGRFLIACHSNYEMIKKLIELDNLQEDKSATVIKTLKILLEANPSKSDFIIQAVEKYLTEDLVDNVEVVSKLETEFQNMIPEFGEIAKQQDNDCILLVVVYWITR